MEGEHKQFLYTTNSCTTKVPRKAKGEEAFDRCFTVRALMVRKGMLHELVKV